MKLKREINMDLLLLDMLIQKKQISIGMNHINLLENIIIIKY